MDDISTEKYIRETIEHIHKVGGYIDMIICFLKQAKFAHDQSKLKAPEISGFVEALPLLSKGKYGSKTYKKGIAILQESGTLQHHYEFNRHHAEHFQNGVDDMNLIDAIEMFADWMAATSRNPGGDIRKSIQMKLENGTISLQLSKLFLNTVDLIDANCDCEKYREPKK